MSHLLLYRPRVEFMSQQGPIVTISSQGDVSGADSMGQVQAFPRVDVNWTDAADAIRRLRPAAVLATGPDADPSRLAALAEQAADALPYLPLILLDPGANLPPNVLPFTQPDQGPDRLTARLSAALRVRALHATLLRRMPHNNTMSARMPVSDPVDDATVLLLGRGGSYPTLSVSLGERMGLVGALSIEAAAKHLNARDFDGIVIGDGFTSRVIDAFLIVLSEDSRFRNLPVILGRTAGLTKDYNLPNLEITDADPAIIASHALPLIRQQAFEARIGRALKSIDVGGLLDPRTGLLTSDAFERDFETSVNDTHNRGAGLSVARITFAAGTTERIRLDAARILSRLMRRMDFATLEEDSIVMVLTEADHRDAHIIARRLTSVLKHTMHSTRRTRLDPHVAVASLMPNDTAHSLLARLEDAGRRAAS